MIELRAAVGAVDDMFVHRSTPLTLNHSPSSQPRRYYIQALDDRAIPVAAQPAMQRQHAVAEVHQVASGHTPMTS